MQISIVIPIYNTIQHLLIGLPSIITLVSSKYTDFEIIIVKDTKETINGFDKLLNIKDNYKQIEIYYLNANYGQHFATLCGFYLAKGKHIVSIDEDTVEYLTELCYDNNYINYNIYYYLYSKNKIYNSINRIFLSKLFLRFYTFILNIKVHSTYRIISKQLRDEILKKKHIYWEIDAMIQAQTDDIGYKSISVNNITDKASGYNYYKLFKMAFKICYEHCNTIVNLIFSLILSLILYSITNLANFIVIIFLIIFFSSTLIYRIRKHTTSTTKAKILKALQN